MPGLSQTGSSPTSREATRAIHDTLPFMKHAKLTTIVTVNGAKGRSPGSRIPGADIAAVIARHGVNVETRDLIVPHGDAIGDALLSRYHRCDLSRPVLPADRQAVPLYAPYTGEAREQVGAGRQSALIPAERAPLFHPKTLTRALCECGQQHRRSITNCGHSDW